MRSRYAMSLYELIAKRFNLTDVNRQKWPLDKFRELIGDAHPLNSHAKCNAGIDRSCDGSEV